MTHSDVICPVPIKWLSQPTSDLLEAMARKPVEITRPEARGFLRAIFGPPGLWYEPQGKGRNVYCLPNTTHALVLDYVEPTAPSEPSRVIARVHWGAVRIVFLTRGRLYRLA